MTRTEFEEWLDGNYTQLAARIAHRQGAEEALQQVVVRLLEDSAPLAGVELRDGLTGWLLARMDGALRNAQKAARTTRRVADAMAEQAVLGADIFKDTSRDTRAARNQRHRPGPAGKAGLILASGSAATEAIWYRGTPILRALGPGDYRLPR
jgi:hypothetical protein